MRKRRNRLNRVLDLAKREERSKLAAIGTAQRSLDLSVNRLEELEAYRKEYAQKFGAGEKLTPARWQDYQNFLRRIDEAVDVQKEQIRIGQETREMHRQRWMMKRQRLDSIERVMARHKKSLMAELERKNQNALDDMAASGGRSRPGKFG